MYNVQHLFSVFEAFDGLQKNWFTAYSIETWSFLYKTGNFVPRIRFWSCRCDSERSTPSESSFARSDFVWISISLYKPVILSVVGRQSLWSGWAVDASLLYESEATPLEWKFLPPLFLLSLKLERQSMPIRLSFLFLDTSHEFTIHLRCLCVDKIDRQLKSWYVLKLWEWIHDSSLDSWRHPSPSPSSNKLLLPLEIALIEEERKRISLSQKWV